MSTLLNKDEPYRGLKKPPEPKGIWVLTKNGYERKDDLPLRHLWVVDEGRDIETIKQFIMADSSPHYIFQLIERLSPDFQIGHLLYSLPDQTDFRKWSPPIWYWDKPCVYADMKSEISQGQRNNRKTLVTFDGISLWRIEGLEESKNCSLRFELRRYSGLNLLLTESLLFLYDMTGIEDEALRKEIEREIRDVEDWIGREKWEAIALACGNICDRILLDRILCRNAKGVALGKYGNKKDPNDWSFSDRIKECCRLGVLHRNSGVVHQLEVARFFSNFRHGGKARKLDVEIGPFDAAGCYAALKNLFGSLLQKR